MDRRRLSARTDVGSNLAPVRREELAQPLLDRAINLAALNWEVMAFIGLMLIAAFSRLVDLGPRAFHHDESIHAYYSDYFLKTGNYTTTAGHEGGYDPTYHGPFLYHATALMFFLFGSNDYNARLAPALFGILLVGLCWLMRPFIGRVGALIATFLVIFSPSINYYSRSLRHDVFALAGIMLLFISILWFVRTHQSKWVYLGAIGYAIAFASHELTYLLTVVFVVFLLLAFFLFPTVANRATAGLRTLAGDEDVNPVKSAWSALMARPWTLLGGVLTFFGIYAVLFTNMLIKPQLIWSGIKGPLYWLSQHEVNRGSQPEFYYMLLMPIYEPLALLAGLATVVWLFVRLARGRADERQPDDIDIVTEGPEDQYGVRYPSMEGTRGFALSFLAFWSFGSFAVFSIAGERLPWLNMHIAMPFSLLAAVGLGALITRVDWREARKGGGIFLGVTVLLFIVSLFVTIAHFTGNMPPTSGQTAETQNFLRTIGLIVVVVGLLALSGWLSYKMAPGRAVAVVAMTFAILLAAYGVRSMSLAVYQHGDVPVEPLIYTQSSPDVPIVTAMVERLARDVTAFDGRNANDVTGGHTLAIFIDQNEAIEWPLDWYFREQKGKQYFNYFQDGQEIPDADKANRIAPNAPVIFASEQTENTAYFKEFIKDKYTTNRYALNWWFPEETYKTNGKGDIGKAFGWLFGGGMRFLLYRDPGLPLGSRNFYLHVRNDLAPQVGLGGVLSTTTEEAVDDGKVYGMFDLAQGASRGQFNLPRGIATDAAGNFYVADTGNFRIQKFGPDGTFQALMGNGKGTGDGQFNPISETGVGTGIGGIAVDAQGNVYVADTWNHRVQKFGPDGKFVAKWGDFVSLADAAGAVDPTRDSKFYGPRGIAVGPDGNIYVTDTGNKRVSIFDANGKFVRQISSNLTPERIAQNYAFNQPGEMNEPIGIAVDGQGNVYVADSLNRRIQKFDATGKFVAQWPVPGNNWEAGVYLEPFLAVDAQGNVYATAPTGAAVLKYNPQGQLLATQRSAGAINLKIPTGITVAPNGDVVVVDTTSHGVVNMGKINP
ncbi:MAG: TIGR03663 family protein [Chloroflexota bacterium]|nr:TIGR03663 family protein [Chloroflexota bacterium]MDQ5864337.1 TIGR03663 family protein [Chloroflexota bacterium]